MIIGIILHPCRAEFLNMEVQKPFIEGKRVCYRRSLGPVQLQLYVVKEEKRFLYLKIVKGHVT